MKVGLIGGTGLMGRALASRLTTKHEILIGSRETQNAESVAETIRAFSGAEVSGGTNTEVAEMCDVAILAVPDLNLSFLDTIRTQLGRKIVISPIVPMKMENGLMQHPRG